MINFERYKELVPEDTFELTKEILLSLAHYDDKPVCMVDYDYSCYNQYSKAFFIIMDALSSIDKYNDLLRMNQYDEDKLNFDFVQYDSNANFAELFAYYSDKFLIFDSEIDYVNMTPLDLLIRALDICIKEGTGDTQFYHVFSDNRNLSMNMFLNNLKDFNIYDKNRAHEQLEKEELGDFSISVKSFLKTASIVRADLLKYYKKDSNFQDIERDSIPLSLLLALEYYEDLSKDQYGISIKSRIQNVLANAGFPVYNQSNPINYNKGESKLPEKFKPNVYAIKELYKKYYEDGIYKGKNKKDVTVQGIIENVLNQQLNDTLIIDRLMKGQHCNPDNLKDFCKLVREDYLAARKSEEIKYVNGLYEDLRNDSTDYLEFATKTFSLIKSKMAEGNHNKSVLTSDDDADTLSLFIASYYFDLDVAKFYKVHGITLDKVLKFLQLDITREEIEKTPLSKKLLVDKFQRFVDYGVNSNTYKQQITPTHLNHNLCNADFNKSSIMKDIFYGLTDNVEMSNDFLKQLKEELNKFEKAEQEKKSKELFEDMDIHTVRYLKKLAKVYDKMLHTTNKIQDPKPFAIILSLYNYENDKTIINTLNGNGLNLQSLFDRSIINYDVQRLAKEDNIDDEYGSSKVDVDLLLDNFKDLIFDSNNKKRSLIEMIKQIPTISSPMTMNQLYDEFGITSELFTNIDEYIEKEKEKVEQEEIEKNARYLFEVNYDVKTILVRAIKYFEYLKNKNLGKNNIEELTDLSVLLSLLSSDSKKFFESNGISLDNVCALLNIDVNELKTFDMDFKFVSYLETFKKYVPKNTSEKCNVTILKEKFFNNNSVLNYIIEELNSKGEQCINPSVLRQEVVNNKPYVDTLSLEERIVLLDGHKVEMLDIDQIGSVLSFGNALEVHSKYIYEEFPKLSNNDSYESSVSSINGLIEKVYGREERRGIFKKLFSSKNDKIEIDLDALKELRTSIDENIRILSEELQSYDKIRLYLEAYRSKNREYLERASEIVNEISEELDTLNPECDAQFDRFVYLKGLLQIMKDKVNRFNTTNIIARQDLIRISQAMVNHSITVNALEMAKNDLFPLIGGELALSRGRDSEKYALELSKNVMDLFQALLSRNLEGTRENLELLKSSQIPMELVETIDKEVDGYLDSVRGLKKTLRNMDFMKIKGSEE